MIAPTNCVLCDLGGETISHIFFRCGYSKCVLSIYLTTAGKLVKGDIDLIEVIWQIDRLATKSKIWTLHLTLLAIMGWLLYMEGEELQI